MINIPANTPAVWGEGLIFGFSGMDGATESATGFVATAGADDFDLLFHTPLKRLLTIRPTSPLKVGIAGNDVLLAAGNDGELILAWSAWHSLVGRAPAGTVVRLGYIDDEGQASTGPAIVTFDAKNRDSIGLMQRGENFAVAFGNSKKEVIARCEAAMLQDLPSVVNSRLAYLDRLPTPGGSGSGQSRLLAKCASVMKVNTLGPEGSISCRWSTPDRVPHRHMWLWDSVFHSLAMNHIDPELSLDFLRAIILSGNTGEDNRGMISHCVRVDGYRSNITQPPVLAWGLLLNHETRPNAAAVADLVPRLEAYLRWNLEHRDANRNHLFEWHIEGDPKCRSGESGLDNSPRFDSAAQLDAVDFSVFMAMDMRALARLLEAGGRGGDAGEWRRRADEVEAALHDLLWDDEHGFYFDRTMSGDLTGVKAVTGFLPLLLDNLPEKRVERLVHMLDSEHFATEFPIPSVAVTEPCFGTDMWRGATWINMNYLVIMGLEKHDRNREAQFLREKTICMVEKYYRAHGVLFEFYDSRDQVAPPDCRRKGEPDGKPYLLGKMNSIRDYHWSAALVLCMLLNEQDGRGHNQI